MALDPDYLGALDRPEIVHHWDWREAAIYSLGLGYGQDPLDKRQLYFLDRGQDMVVHPAMVNVLGYDGAWLRDERTGVDYLKVVHGEQEMEIHAPLPLEGAVSAKTRVDEIIDKGEGKGALIVTSRDLTDSNSGKLLATVRHTIFCRGAGGFGGSGDATRQPHPVPDRNPDGSMDIVTPPQLALIYRLSGDLNPLHSDPEVARRAGFERPILHGLSTFGIACRALMGALANDDPARVKALGGRFSAPVFPGDTITFDWWVEDAGRAAFNARVGDRPVLKNGRFEYVTGDGA